jgi:hypothetical protein
MEEYSKHNFGTHDIFKLSCKTEQIPSRMVPCLWPEKVLYLAIFESIG